jgi:N-acetylglucosaminyldiphosphoundecaprenol N-acetyl-beta-D-mannosaminyltransferase
VPEASDVRTLARRPRAHVPATDVLGVKISSLTPALALDQIACWIAEGAREYVCVTGVHGVVESQRDPAVRDIHNRAGMVTPDGMPMVWASHWAGATWVRRVYGPDLMLAVSERAAERGWSSYFYGGADGIAPRVADVLSRRFPGLRVAGTHTPPFRPMTEEEDRSVVDAINTAAPDIVWVGLSTPKQERWMALHRGALQAPVLIGVGAAFDFHTGAIRQAPRWLQSAGLEWAYRVAVEPRRLWRRYLLGNSRFIWELARRLPDRPRMISDPKRSTW